MRVDRDCLLSSRRQLLKTKPTSCIGKVSHARYLSDTPDTFPIHEVGFVLSSCRRESGSEIALVRLVSVMLRNGGCISYASSVDGDAR